MTILVKNHIFEVKFRPNEGRQPGHTRPQQVGWWSTWSDLDLDLDLETSTGRNPSIVLTRHVKSYSFLWLPALTYQTSILSFENEIQNMRNRVCTHWVYPTFNDAPYILWIQKIQIIWRLLSPDKKCGSGSQKKPVLGLYSKEIWVPGLGL